MWTGNLVVGAVATQRRWSAGDRVEDDSRSARGCGLFVDADIPASRTERGQIGVMAFAGPWPLGSVASSWARTFRCHDCGRGQNATADCLRSGLLRDCALTVAESGSRTGHRRGRCALVLRGCSVPAPRLIRGRRILVATRGKACPVLIMM